MDTLGNYLSKLSKNTKYLKYISIGILAYSAYHFFRKRNHKQKKNNKKEISIPEHIKYDNGWYDELDEIKKRPTTTPEAILSEPPPTIQEVTPRGEILMYYDVKNKAFEYYSNNKNLPYKTLDAVARKYACTHNVPSIYVDLRDEVKKGLDKYNNSNSNVVDKNASAAKNASPSSSVFAVYKNYKSGIKTPASIASIASTGGGNGNIGNGNGNGNKPDSKNNSKKIILKDNVNKFIFKGWINDYALDAKAREKKEKSSIKLNKHKSGDDDGDDDHNQENVKKEEINISYAEFKKRMKNE